MIFEHSDYRSYLRSVLTERMQKNGSYSLRAMARQIGCAPSTLSDILKGSKGLSQNKALSVSLKLGLSAPEAEYFGLLVQMARTSSSDAKDYCMQRMRALNPRREVRDLSVDAFKLIADWYHLPLLELVGIQGFRLTAVNAANKLGITSLEAQTALDRLQRLDLVELQSDGSYRRLEGRHLVSSQTANGALRRYHKQMLEKAIASLEEQSPQEKFVGSENIPFDSNDLPEAEKITERYFDELIALSNRAKKKDAVYHAGVQLFRLTSNSNSKSTRRTS